MIARRGFLAGILAAGVAPAAVGSQILMPVRPLLLPGGFVVDQYTWWRVKFGADFGAGDDRPVIVVHPSFLPEIGYIQDVRFIVSDKLPGTA